MRVRSIAIAGCVLFLLGLAPAAFPGGNKDSGAAPGAVSWSEFQEPPIEYRPWVRWWWPGNDVEDKELRREIKLLYDNGFGGVEIQCFTMGLDPKASKEEMERRLSFDTPSFYEHVHAVMDEARKYGMGVDLTLGSGWPSGGAHITPAMGMKTLLWSQQKVTGPRRVHGKLKAPEKPSFYKIAKLAKYLVHSEIAEYKGKDAKLMAVVAYKVLPGKAADAPKAQRLDPKSAQVITDKVDADGVLTWEAPAGKWVIVTAYIAPDGERPTLSAQSDPGFVVDHFDAKAALANVEHLAGERTGLLQYAGSSFRGFFNDSFEFKTERHFTPDFLAEFKKRRGYDLTPYLAALKVPGGDNFFMDAMGGVYPVPDYVLSDQDARVRYDYDLTVSDLFIERYLDPLQKWAHEHGLKSRAQPYGLNIDVIRAMGHVDIPETEQLYAGGSEMFLKLASSGAHLAGKNIVSAESFVWAGRDYMTTPLKIKAAADKLFTAGINHIIYHGYSYRKTDPKYGETGWFPWSSPFVPLGTFSTNMSEANPYWKYIRQINLYIARCQYLLRQGKPDYDLIVYYPFLGFPTSFGQVKGHDELLFNGQFDGEPEMKGGGLDALAPLLGGGKAPDPRIAWLQKVWPLLQDLEIKGYTWEWVNDDSLAKAQEKDGRIVIGDNEYKALVIANAPWMRAEAVNNLLKLSDQGAAFLLAGDLPEIQPGYLDYQLNDKVIKKAWEKIASSARAEKYESSSKVNELLADLGVKPEVLFANTSNLNPSKIAPSQLRRRLADGSRLVFFNNGYNDSVRYNYIVYRLRSSDGKIISASCCANQRLAYLTPWTGEAGLMDDKICCPDNTERLFYFFHPYESFFHVFTAEGSSIIDNLSKNKLYENLPQKIARSGLIIIPIEISHIEVIGEDNTVIFPYDFNKPIKGMECGAIEIYSAKFELDEIPAHTTFGLGIYKINGTAELIINGEDAGVFLFPPYVKTITKFVKKGVNTLEIRINSPLRNSLICRGESGDKRYKQFKDKQGSMLPFGISGYVHLTLETNEYE